MGIQKLCHRLTDRQISLNRQWISHFSWTLTSRELAFELNCTLTIIFLSFSCHSARIIAEEFFSRVVSLARSFWSELIAMHENEQIAYILQFSEFEQDVEAQTTSDNNKVRLSKLCRSFQAFL